MDYKKLDLHNLREWYSKQIHTNVNKYGVRKSSRDKSIDINTIYRCINKPERCSIDLLQNIYKKVLN